MRISILCLLIFGCFGSTYAQLSKPVKWEFDTEKIDDNLYEVSFTATIDGSWYLYSQDLPNDDGPIATTFEFEEINGAQLIGEVVEVGNAIKAYDNMFSMELKYYKRQVEFKQQIRLEAGQAKATGFFTFMTCNSDQCLPPTDVDFSFNLDKTR